MKKKVIAAVVIVATLLVSVFILLHGITVASLSIDKNEIVDADNLLVNVNARHIGVPSPIYGGFETPHLTIVKTDNSAYKIFDLRAFGYPDVASAYPSGWYWTDSWSWVIDIKVGNYAVIDNYIEKNNAKILVYGGIENYCKEWGLRPVETGSYIVQFDIAGKACTSHLSIAGENQPVEKEEEFHLGIGESKNIVIGETEICITLVTCDPFEGTAEIRYSLDDNVTTRTFELHIGDTAIVVDLPEGKINLLGFGEFPVIRAGFKVSGNFEIKP